MTAPPTVILDLRSPCPLFADGFGNSGTCRVSFAQVLHPARLV